jgi:hypothetical protein
MKLREFGVAEDTIDVEELVGWTRTQAARQGGQLSDEHFRQRVEQMQTPKSS